MRTTKKDEKFLQLLQDFQNAHQDLAEFFTEDDDDSYSLIAPNVYPFEQSFDDYLSGIKTWVQWTVRSLTPSVPKQTIEQMVSNPPMLETISDVHTWFRQLYDQGVNMHPDNDFDDYKGISRLSAVHLNVYMEECFTLCRKMDIDIYEIAQNAFHEWETAQA